MAPPAPRPAGAAPAGAPAAARARVSNRRIRLLRDIMLIETTVNIGRRERQAAWV